MLKIALIFLFLGLTARHSLAQEETYGAYNLYAQGSLQAVGMGGTSTALSDGASGAISNPAGLVMGDYIFSFDSSNNPVDNTEQGTEIENDSQFFMASAAAHLGKNWAVAAAYNTPYLFEFNESFSSFESKVELTSINAAISRRFKNFSVGVTGNYVTANLIYEDGTSSASDKASTIYPTVGLSYRNDRYGFGVSYSPNYNIDIDESKQSDISSSTSTTFFRDIEVPSKLSVGIFYQLSAKTLIALEVNRFGAPENSVAPEFNASGTSEFALAEIEQLTYHLGMEYHLASSKELEITFRGGTYLEPSKVNTSDGLTLLTEESSDSRIHITFGIEARMGPVVIGVSFDQAKGFQNSSQALSLSLGSI